MIPRNLLYLGIAAGGFCAMTVSAYAADQVAPAAPTQAAVAPATVPVQPPAPSEFEDKEAFTAMGYMISRQMRMNVGFNDQQIEWICEGFKTGVSEAPIPANYRDDLHRAEMIYRSHTMKMMEKERDEANENAKLGEAFINNLPDKDKLTKTASGLYYEILAPGNPDKKPTNADRVKVMYTGSLIDGKAFDKSPEPIEFAVGGVVPGFSEGLKLIGEGGKIRLYIPGSLGYGMQPPPNSPIKAGATLIFEAEITEVIKGEEKPALHQPSTAPEGANMPRSVRRNPSMTPPPPPPTTPPPPLPPEVLAQLKNSQRPVPSATEAAKPETSDETEAKATETTK